MERAGPVKTHCGAQTFEPDDDITVLTLSLAAVQAIA
jgi:hypothetical protein